MFELCGMCAKCDVALITQSLQSVWKAEKLSQGYVGGLIYLKSRTGRTCINMDDKKEYSSSNTIPCKLKNFLDNDGRLLLYPAKRKIKILALSYLAGKFESGNVYSEKQVNEILCDWHTFEDPATLRRELFGYHFIDRTTDCKIYRLTDPQPIYEDTETDNGR